MTEANFFVMSVDVDSWSSLLRFYSIEHDAAEVNRDVSVDYGISRLLELFNAHELKATFFVPGEVAKEDGQTIKRVAQEGHEVACHGLSHEKNEYLLPSSQQLAALEEATKILQKVTSCKPKGFRAPCLRANAQTIKTLERLEYAYDSSVIPSFVPGYYGYSTTQSKPYYPSLSSIATKGKSKIVELPVSVHPLLRIPLSAAWMRNLGANWVGAGARMNFYLGNPVVFYVHPRDVTPLPAVKGLPWHLRRNAGPKAIEMLNRIIKEVKKHAEILPAADLAARFAGSLNA